MGHCIGMAAYLGQYGGTVNQVEFQYSECRLCICVLLHLPPLLSSFKLALTDLASFPGSYVGREKEVHTVCACSVNFWNFRKVCPLH